MFNILKRKTSVIQEPGTAAEQTFEETMLKAEHNSDSNDLVITPPTPGTSFEAKINLLSLLPLFRGTDAKTGKILFCFIEATSKDGAALSYGPTALEYSSLLSLAELSKIFDVTISAVDVKTGVKVWSSDMAVDDFFNFTSVKHVTKKKVLKKKTAKKAIKPKAKVTKKAKNVTKQGKKAKTAKKVKSKKLVIRYRPLFKAAAKNGVPAKSKKSRKR